jgi:5'-3' exonuclease
VEHIKKRPVLLIDALNFFTRHYVVNPTMSTLGHHAGGTVGFLKGIRHLADKLLPKQVIVVWEGGGSPRRRAIFSDYKAQRKPPKLNRFYGDDIPDSVGNRDYQIALAIELLKNVPTMQVYVSDCEADDVIGYLAKYKLQDEECVIVSSDKDFYQLLSSRVSQWSPGQKAFVTEENVKGKFSIPPHNFCVVRSFCGDPSDCIPGIKGAGFKSLAKRFPELKSQDFVSVEEILTLSKERAQNSKIKLFANINADSEIVRRNWKLMYLDIANLSGTQIQKIESAIDTFTPTRNKIGLMRVLIREGLSMFDADAFFMSMNSSLHF